MEPKPKVQEVKSVDFDDILKEIDQTEHDHSVKSQLTVGALCEVYSRSQRKWVKAKVIKTFNDDDGEWMMVKFNGNTIKEIQRYSTDIRVMMNEANNVNDKDIITNEAVIDYKSVNWDEIVTAIRDGDLQYIKNIITSNDIDINEQNPENGKTLLMYSVVIGNIDLTRAICNYGADVHIKDNDGADALDYAVKYGRYKVTELIYYQQLSSSLGIDLKNIATSIHDKNKEAQLIKDFRNDRFVDNIIEYMIEAIKKRSPFSADLLFYAWYFVSNDGYPQRSFLWQQMMETYESILCDTTDKKGWQWLKKYFINSLIWYLPHPDPNTQYIEHDDDGDMQNVLKLTLFWELLFRVRAESKKQSDLYLKEEIDEIKEEKANEWKQLISYNVHTKYSSNARQDVSGCLLSKYNQDDLSKYPPSTHFNAQKHYDKNIYLNQLLFNANILDSEFQHDMKGIAKQIGSEYNIRVLYRAGPVKTLTRAQAKVENDYINEDYPTSAKILDICRCALQFETVKGLMKFIEVLTDRIKNRRSGCIEEIIRCKNGWSVYNTDYPQYSDIKLNVLVRSSTDKDKIMIMEIQLLLDLMSAFKKKAHKLYSIERKFEIVYQFGLLKNSMRKFKDNNGLQKIFLNLVKTDDAKYFKLLWNLINPTANTLMGIENIDGGVILNIIRVNGKIHHYLQTKFKDLYYETLSKFIYFVWTNPVLTKNRRMDLFKMLYTEDETHNSQIRVAINHYNTYLYGLSSDMNVKVPKSPLGNNNGIILWLDSQDKSTLTFDGKKMVKWRCKAKSQNYMDGTNSATPKNPYLRRFPDVYCGEGLFFDYDHGAEFIVPVTNLRTICSLHSMENSYPFTNTERKNRKENFYIFTDIQHCSFHSKSSQGLICHTKWAHRAFKEGTVRLDCIKKEHKVTECRSWEGETKIAILSLFDNLSLLNFRWIGREREYHHYSGTIMELIVFDRALSEKEKEKVENYFVYKHFGPGIKGIYQQCQEVNLSNYCANYIIALLYGE